MKRPRPRGTRLTKRSLALVALAALLGGGLAAVGSSQAAFASGTPLTITGYTVTPDPSQGGDEVTIALTVQNQSSLQICGPNDPRDCFIDTPPNAVHIEMPSDVQYVDNGIAGVTDPNDMEGVAAVDRPGFNGPVDIVSTCSYFGSFLGLTNQGWDCSTPGLWPQESMTYSWRVRLPANPSTPTRTFTAKVSQYPTNYTPPTYDTASVDAHILQPDLIPVFYDSDNPPSQVLASSGFTYNVEVLNHGAGRTNLPVDLRVDLPLALTSAGVNGNSSGTCTYHHPTLIDEERYVFCTFDQLEAGASATVSIAANAPSTAQTLQATATADPSNNINESDKSNNVAVIDTQVVQDTTPPVVTGTPDRAADSDGWYNHPVTVTWSATDPDNSSSQLSCDSPATYSGPDSATASVTGSCTDPAGNTGSGTVSLLYDATPPVVTDGGGSGTLGNSGWYVSPVTEAFTASDATSGLADCPGSFTRTSTSQGSAVTISSGPCSDNARNTNPGVTSGPYMIDTTPPSNVTFTGGGLTDGASYVFGLVPAGPTGCTASDAVSGFDHCNVTGYGTSVGTHTVTATAYDVAGNNATATLSYKVLPWTLTGFYPPVDMAQTWNGVKSGSTVPLKFNVYQGPAGPATMLSNTADINQPLTATQVSCADESTVTTDTATTTGATSLRWDPTANQFVYNWATPSNKSGTCWFVTLTTADGSHLIAPFKLTK